VRFVENLNMQKEDYFSVTLFYYCNVILLHILNCRLPVVAIRLLARISYTMHRFSDDCSSSHKGFAFAGALNIRLQNARAFWD
jgi:hypothetical protein